jgi:ribosome-associated heat shock protein Hsp15
LSETAGLRLDKWLWHARFIRHRGMAAELVGERRVRVNDQLVAKTHQLVRPGDVLSVRWNGRLRIVRISDLGRRRGPAPEAQTLYVEILDEDSAGQDFCSAR